MWFDVSNISLLPLMTAMCTAYRHCQRQHSHASACFHESNPAFRRLKLQAPTLLLPCGASTAVCSTKDGAAPVDVPLVVSAERQKRRNVVVPDVPAARSSDEVWARGQPRTTCMLRSRCRLDDENTRHDIMEVFSLVVTWCAMPDSMHIVTQQPGDQTTDLRPGARPRSPGAPRRRRRRRAAGPPPGPAARPPQPAPAGPPESEHRLVLWTWTPQAADQP